MWQGEDSLHPPPDTSAPAEGDALLSGLLADLLGEWEQFETTAGAPAGPAEDPQPPAAMPVPLETPDSPPDSSPPPPASPAQNAGPPSVPARRESVLRLMAAMYPEAASRVPGLPPVDWTAVKSGRSAAHGYVVFHLASESFAVPLRNVIEADRLPEVTPVPTVPEFVSGVINRRGAILPLLDLRALLGMPEGRDPSAARMLVVRRRESEPPSAFVVDGLGGIAWLPLLSEPEPSGPVSGLVCGLLSGSGLHRDAPVHVLDLDRLFARKELAELAV